MKENINNNPLLCDPENGICELPNTTQQEGNVPVKNKKKPVHITYFTDPICSSCWGIEPQLRKMKSEYGDYITIEYHMGGLLPSWDGFNGGGISGPSDVAHHWDEVSRYYDMPIDGDVWLEDPLSSSYPPSIAFKAAQLQDEEKAVLFLRRMREMVFLEKKNIGKWEHIQQAAFEAGLDTVVLKTDFEGRANEAFQEDLALAKKLGVRGFPTLFFSDACNNQVLLHGSKPYESFEEAVLKLVPHALKKDINTDVHALFGQYPTLTTKEYATLTNLSKEKAEEMLNTYYNQKLLTKTRIKNGTLWKYMHASR